MLKSSKKKKDKSGKSKNSIIKSIIRFFKQEKTSNIIGLLFILFAAYLVIAFTSFLFTWKYDQDLLLNNRFWEIILNGDIEIQNWLGKIGAITSHIFIHNWFGVSSFLFVLIFFLLGFKIIFNISLLPIYKTIKISSFSLLWISCFMAFIFQEQLFFLGGAFGFEIIQFLVATLGQIGTGFLLFFLLFSFIIINFDVSLNVISDKIGHLFSNESIKESSTVEESYTDDFSSIEELQTENSENIQSNIEVNISESINDKIELDNSIEEEINEDEGTIELETKVPQNIYNQSESEEDDLELTVEEPTKKEEILPDKEVDKKIQDFGEYDPKLDLSSFKMPTIELLENHGGDKINVDRDELEQNKNRIVETLKNYKIEISKIKATIGPTVTLYEIVPAPGVRISKIKNLEDDIALSLSALGIRIIAPIPGRGTVGIEVPNQHPETVSMRTAIASDKFQNTKMDLPIAIGKNISNETIVVDLAKMPHLLMAGATGQGKSVGLNCILVSLLYKKHPSQVKFILVDPKKVELTLFNKIERHYLAKLPDEEEPIITDTKKVVNTLNSLCIEMDQRYELLKNAAARNIKEYNAKFIQRKLNPENGHRYLPYIVLVVDEFADLIMTAGKEVETPIARLAQLARAIGIHLIIATQRPSVNIITGTIKANFPSRIAFRVTSKIDSRTILDAGGADQLIGRGDLLMSTGSDLIRIQCAFVDTPEVEKICDFIGDQRSYPDAFLLPEYVDESSEPQGSIEDIDRDVKFEEAARIVVLHQQGSASLLQRKLKLGYNRAGRIVDQLELAGIIGPFEGSKARQVLIPDEISLEHLLNRESETE